MAEQQQQSYRVLVRNRNGDLEWVDNVSPAQAAAYSNGRADWQRVGENHDVNALSRLWHRILG